MISLLRRSVAALVVAVLLASATGCVLARSTRNEPVDATALAGLTPGTTTAAHVVERFGGPTRVVQLGERSAYLYDYSNTKGAGLFLLVLILGNADTREDRVWLFFDENDVLSHWGATLHGHRTQYAMPWEDIHEAEDGESRDADRTGLDANGGAVTGS